MLCMEEHNTGGEYADIQSIFLSGCSVILLIFIASSVIDMCQFLCCDCWWFNCLGVPCGGYHNAYCICSYWLCKPIELTNIDPECCHVCAFDGWGYNCFCWGNVFCAPQSVRDWSKNLSGGGSAGQVEIINNNYTQ